MLHPPVINFSVVTKMLAPVLGQLMWPLIGLGALLAVAVVIKLALQAAERRRLEHSGIRDIDRMAGRTFEKYLAVVFRKHGYRVELTRASKDQGADLVITKDGRRTAVQAKRWKQHVGNSAVQEIVAAKAIYKAEHAMIVTNSFFTKPAQQLARANDVVLWDRNQLVAELVKANAKQQAAAESQPVPSDADPGPCPHCGRPLVRRKNKATQLPFWGCSDYPSCKYIRDIR